MKNKLDEEIAMRTVILYLFEPKKMLQSNFSFEDFKCILEHMVDFCKMSYYPKYDRDQLFSVLFQFREFKDEKSKLINDFIVRMNETISVKDTKIYVEEVQTRGLVKIDGINIDILIRQYIADIKSDLDVLRTHTVSGYFIENPVKAEVLCNDKNYYKVIEYLINECEELKTNPVFIDNVNEVMNHISKAKIKWFTCTRVKKLLKNKG